MLTEFGVTTAIGLRHVDQLRERMGAQESNVPAAVKDAMQTLFALLVQLDEHVETLTQAIKTRAKASDDAQQMMRVPGIGPITALAIQAFAGDLKGFRNGREFAVWLGLMSKEYSTRGKHRLGAITKMGQRDIRQLLVASGMAGIVSKQRFDASNMSPWLTRMLDEKPK